MTGRSAFIPTTTPTTTMTHQINETHLGDTATAEEAQDVARNLTQLGYPSEYTSMQGIQTYLTDPETGEETHIPSDIWDSALMTTTTLAVEFRITKIVSAALHSDVTICRVLPDGSTDGYEELRVEHDAGATARERADDIDNEVAAMAAES